MMKTLKWFVKMPLLLIQCYSPIVGIGLIEIYLVFVLGFYSSEFESFKF